MNLKQSFSWRLWGSGGEGRTGGDYNNVSPVFGQINNTQLLSSKHNSSKHNPLNSSYFEVFLVAFDNEFHIETP